MVIGVASLYFSEVSEGRGRFCQNRFVTIVQYSVIIITFVSLTNYNDVKGSFPNLKTNHFIVINNTNLIYINIYCFTIIC